MADVDVILPDGTPGTVPAESVAANARSGGHVASPAEVAGADAGIARRNAPITASGVAGDLADTWAAGQHAAVRGVGEAFGIPVDTAATGIASAFGPEAEKSTRSYLKGLDERHPIASGWMGMTGNVQGALGAAELVGAPGSIGAGVAPRTVGGIAARAAYGGAENVVQATTRDINESSLGDHAINGEKIVAQMPKHFIVGAAITGAFEGGAAALEHGIASAFPKAASAADEAATRAVGAEVGDEAAGGRIRNLTREQTGREIPRSSSELADILGAEQSAQRGRAVTAHEAAVSEQAATHEGEASALSARHEAERGPADLEAMARGGARVEEAELGRATEAVTAETAHAEAAKAAQALNAVTDHHAVIREALVEEHSSAVKAAKALESEVSDNAGQLEKAISRAEKEGSTGKGSAVADSMTQVERADGRLTREQFDEIVSEQLGMTGHARDPSTRWAFEKALEEHYGPPVEAAEQLAERAEKATVMAAPSTTAEVERLQGLAEQLSAAHKEALGHVQAIGKAIAAADKEAARDVATVGSRLDRHIEAFQKTQKKEAQAGIASVEAARSAGEKDVAAARVAFERNTKKEHAALKAKHLAEDRKLPKLSEKTDVDVLLRNLRSREAANAATPAISSGAKWGAGISLFHGNPLAAAGDACSFAAGKLRANGNLLRARALREISERLSAVDNAVRKGAASILGRTGAEGANAAVRAVSEAMPQKKQPTFEQVAQNLADAKANPQIIERKVNKMLGPIATDAPNTYGEVLASTQRAQSFLSSILPEPQKDPNSLTPHLIPGDTSSAAKYDFMQVVHTVSDPLSIFKDVTNGTVSERQVEAISEVYPLLYKQMQDEVKRQILDLKEPIPYEREINVGTLLGISTNEVLDPDFQKAIRDSYDSKVEQGKPMGSKPTEKEANNNTMKSTSQQVEGGMS